MPRQEMILTFFDAEPDRGKRREIPAEEGRVGGGRFSEIVEILYFLREI
jgi:hypothetical protein